MTLKDRIRGRVASERGGVVLFVAIMLPALLAAFAIALDVGNWFAHHRALQNQVDAAALAGGALYAACFQMPQDQAEAAIESEAGTYAVRNPADLAAAPSFNYNSNTYPSGASTSDPISNVGHPCASPLDFEVKGSYQNIPLIFGGLLPGSTPLSHLEAHARVSLRQVQSETGELPLAVPSTIAQLSNNPVLLRQTGGSVTTADACDKTGEAAFTTAIENGCTTPYQVNPTGTCPDPAAPAGPLDCVPNKPGNFGQPTDTALDTRYGGCPANNWPNYNPQTDPRLVVLLVTDPAYLGGNGSTPFPVLGFAEFYITGWHGSSCNNGPFPAGNGSPTKGDIWGYFVKDVVTSGSGGDVPCNPALVFTCTPVLTR